MTIAPPPRFSIEDFRARATGRLSPAPPDGEAIAAPVIGDHALNLPALDADAIATARPAAVLAPIIARPEGPTVLLTQRASALRSHSGQIAFPGGKIDPGETPLAAALREAREEIGLDPEAVEPIGWLSPYFTGTGFRVLPLVGIVEPPLSLVVNHDEVAEVFETPLKFLMDEANHQLHQREWRGRLRRFYAMPYEERYIWGATAGILRHLYERLYS